MTAADSSKVESVVLADGDAVGKRGGGDVSHQATFTVIDKPGPKKRTEVRHRWSLPSLSSSQQGLGQPGLSAQSSQAVQRRAFYSGRWHCYGGL
jgi:hypothetical protein